MGVYLDLYLTGKATRKAFLEDGLAEAGGALEVRGHHRLQLLHHAQSPLHFRHEPRLLDERWKQIRSGHERLLSQLATPGRESDER